MTMLSPDDKDRLFYKLAWQKAQVGMLFGAKTISREVAKTGARLYHEGRVSKLIVSGGATVGSLTEKVAMVAYHLRQGNFEQARQEISNPDYTCGAMEADFMRTVLLSQGVAEGDIIYSDRTSKNTQQNLENCAHALIDFSTVAFVTFAPQQRRALGTARFMTAFDNITITTVPVFPRGLNENSADIFPLSYFVKQELEKMNPSGPKSYVGRFCEDPDIAKEQQRLNEIKLG